MVIALVAQHEFIKSVRPSFDTVDGAILSIDLATRKHSSIARRAHGLLILRLINLASVFLKASREELRESFVVTEVGHLNLVHIDSIELGEGAVEHVPDWIGHVGGADKASKSRSDARDGHDVLEVTVLLEGFIERVDGVPPRQHLAKECHSRVVGGARVRDVSLEEHPPWNRESVLALGQ